MQQAARYRPPAPPDPAELAGLCATLRSLSEAAGRGALGPDGWAELADRVTELTALERQRSLGWRLRAAELAAARAEGFEAGRASAAAARPRTPRLPRQRALWPVRVVPSVIPLAKVAAAVTATAAAVTAVAVGAHPAAAPHARSWHGPHGSAAASLAPADGVPVVLPEPAYQPRHASLDAKSSAPVTVRVVPSWRPPRQPARSSPQPPAPAAAAGTLDVATVRVAATEGEQGQIVFTAEGGPVSWSAASDSSEVTLTAAGDLTAGGTRLSGTLAAGEPLILTVTVAPGSPLGMATITLTGSDGTVQTVPVYWM